MPCRILKLSDWWWELVLIVLMMSEASPKTETFSESHYVLVEYDVESTLNSSLKLIMRGQDLRKLWMQLQEHTTKDWK